MNNRKLKYIEITLVASVWIVLMAIPILLREDYNSPAWRTINNQLEILIPVSLLFLLNRFVLVPVFLFRKKITLYTLSLTLMLFVCSYGSYYYDTNINFPSGKEPVDGIQEDHKPDHTSDKPGGPAKSPQPKQRQPRPVPPFANVIVLSVLMVGFDTGIRSGLRWIESENEKVRLEKENVANQLVLLQNQVSPHFFMNTLNNIYSLIESDKDRSKKALMKLSKLMRYLLYENQSGRVFLSKEFDFIRNYIDLMKLRFAEDVEIKLSMPEIYTDIEIPSLLFISYLENAFKYGASYQQKSLIEAIFNIEGEHLTFSCTNSKSVFSENNTGSGMGLQNIRRRLDLLYKNSYALKILETEETFSVQLQIPVK